jgi:hypothetical protein
MEEYTAYLTILRQLASTLEKLSVLGREKLAAVRNDDLAALNETLKQEQVLSLTVRSLEQKMRTEQDQLHLSDTRLADLVGRYPADMKTEAKQVAEQLQQQYQVYKGVSEAARAALECGLHEIEKVLGDAGVEPVGDELPASLRTDIHA